MRYTNIWENFSIYRISKCYKPFRDQPIDELRGVLKMFCRRAYSLINTTTLPSNSIVSTFRKKFSNKVEALFTV